MRCEGCGLDKLGVLQRANGQALCGSCNLDRLREMSPTGLTRKEEMVAIDLYKYYRKCNIGHEDAIEKLAFILAMAPDVFTRLVGLLERLRNNDTQDLLHPHP